MFTEYFIELSIVSYLFFFLMILDKNQYLKREIDYRYQYYTNNILFFRLFVLRTEGRYLACTCRAKYIEVSVGINHNVDELLVGILTQIRLKRADGGEGHDHWYKNRNILKASLKARQMFTWVFGKEDTKMKNCENLQVL